MDGGLVEWQSLVNENSRGQDTLMTMTVVDAGWTNDETGSNRKKLSLVLVHRVLYYYYCFAVHCRGYLWRIHVNIHPFQGQEDVEISFFS